MKQDTTLNSLSVHSKCYFLWPQRNVTVTSSMCTTHGDQQQAEFVYHNRSITSDNKPIEYSGNNTPLPAAERPLATTK